MRRRLAPRLAAVVLGGTAAHAPALAAQEPASVRCQGQPISAITVRSLPPDFGPIAARWRPLASVVHAVHVDTRPDVVRRFLTLKEGDRCTERERAESEHILIVQPFIASAEIRAYPSAGDSVRLVVTTTDEIATVLAAKLSAPSPHLRGGALGYGNIGGEGVFGVVRWQEGFFYRDRLDATLVDYQLLGKPVQLALDGERGELGSHGSVDLTRPYLSEHQRLAWRVAGRTSSDYFTYLREDGPFVAARFDHTDLDLGGVVRLGRPRRSLLLGGAFTTERQRPLGGAVIVTPTGLVPPETNSFAGRFPRFTTARLNVLFGLDATRYRRVTGFDALAAPQDVTTGVELGAMTGYAVGTSRGVDRDVFVSGDLYAGAGGPWLFGKVELRGEARRAADASQWSDLLAHGRAALYVKPQASQTLIATAGWSGGARLREPFQLTLADTRGGLPGYHRAREGGGRRLIGTLEQRWGFGRPVAGAKVGVSVFGSAGRLWAGDTPFGVTTPLRSTAGLALLAAIPPRSQRMWRLELLHPFNAVGRPQWQVRLSNVDRARLWPEPNDVRRSRSHVSRSGLFDWP